MRCRQRKKGCDLKRPACGQCLQRGSTCPGYGTGMTFVHDSRSVSSNRTSATRDLIRSLALVSTPPSFIQSATQIGLSDHFWYIYLPRKFASLGSQQGGLDDFFQAVGHLSSDEVVLKHAFWALSLLIIGCEVSNSGLLLQGSRMYGQALKELRAAIEDVRNKSLTSSAEMAMTCNLLALYEVGSLSIRLCRPPTLTLGRYSTIPARHGLASSPTAEDSPDWYSSEGPVAFARALRGQHSRAFVQPSSSPPYSVAGLLSCLQTNGVPAHGNYKPNHPTRELSISPPTFRHYWNCLTKHNASRPRKTSIAEVCNFWSIVTRLTGHSRHSIKSYHRCLAWKLLQSYGTPRIAPMLIRPFLLKYTLKIYLMAKH